MRLCRGVLEINSCAYSSCLEVLQCCSKAPGFTTIRIRNDSGTVSSQLVYSTIHESSTCASKKAIWSLGDTFVVIWRENSRLGS